MTCFDKHASCLMSDTHCIFQGDGSGDRVHCAGEPHKELQQALRPRPQDGDPHVRGLRLRG